MAISSVRGASGSILGFVSNTAAAATAVVDVVGAVAATGSLWANSYLATNKAEAAAAVIHDDRLIAIKVSTKVADVDRDVRRQRDQSPEWAADFDAAFKDTMAAIQATKAV